MRKYFGSLCSHFFWDTIWNGYHRRNSQVNIPLITDFCKDRTKNVEVIFGGVGTNSLHSHIFWQIAPIIELDLTVDPRNLPWKFGHDPRTRSKVRVHYHTEKMNTETNTHTNTQTNKQTNKQTNEQTNKEQKRKEITLTKKRRSKERTQKKSSKKKTLLRRKVGLTYWLKEEK